MTRKHKLEKLILSSIPCDSLKFSPPTSYQEETSQYDNDTTMSPSSPLFSPLPPPTPRATETAHTTFKFEFEYWLCDYRSDSSDDLQQHIQIKHKIDASFS